MGSCCGSVGRAVTSGPRGPRLESSHRQKIVLNIYCQLYKENKQKEAGIGPFLKKTSCNVFFSVANENQDKDWHERAMQNLMIIFTNDLTRKNFYFFILFCSSDPIKKASHAAKTSLGRNLHPEKFQRKGTIQNLK